MSVLVVARRHNVNANQLFIWRGQHRRGELVARPDGGRPARLLRVEMRVCVSGWSPALLICVAVSMDWPRWCKRRCHPIRSQESRSFFAAAEVTGLNFSGAMPMACVFSISACTVAQNVSQSIRDLMLRDRSVERLCKRPFFKRSSCLSVQISATGSLYAGMRSISSELRKRRRRGLDRVAALCRRLGHTPGSITVYCNWCILEEFDRSDYTQLYADHVVQRSRSYARRHEIDEKRCRWMWLSTFRAVAWRLGQLGKAVGSVELHPQAAPVQDSMMLAFIHCTKELGRSQSTLRGGL